MDPRPRHPYHPFPNPDMQVYWDGVRRGKLLYQVCNGCRSVIFHPRVMCPYCLSDDIRYEQSVGRGIITQLGATREANRTWAAATLSAWSCSSPRFGSPAETHRQE